MNRKYNLKLDLQFRCNNSTMKFRQSDNKTSDFFIRITRSGELFDVNNAIAILAVIKPDNTSQAQFLEIKEGKVYADLNNNMKDQVGKYKAQALLIMEDERVSTDVIEYDVTEDNILNQLEATVSSTDEFTMLQEILSRLSNIEQQEEQRMINEAERILSEENRKIEETKRVEAELIRQHEEADRAKYDATRESNENTRKQNESIRLANEANRIDEETKRVEEENKRKLAEEERNANYNFMTEDEERRRLEANAHKEAEVLRVQAETNRVNEEAKRRTTEQARVSAENTRVNNENTRKANETTRQTNEAKRVEAETQRQNRYNSFIADAEANASNFENYTNTAKVKEEERKSNELDRKSQEDRRVSNEVERISNENTRKANEVVREKNEASRQNTFTNKVNEVDKKIIEINTTKDNFVSSINTKVDTKISELNTTKDNFISSVNTKVDTKISEIEVAKSEMTTTVSNKLNDVDEKIIEINATKDDFVSSVNTKVDNKISELDNAKSDMATTISNKVNEVETRFNALTSSQQQDAEVIDARDGETSLKARLDRDIEKAKQVYVDVEGSHISSDSSVGYAKDVEILGNTVQSASNLADIRSVGDKVEGQELYEIPVLSVGKNLFDGNKFTPREAINQYSYIDGILTMSCDGQAYRRVDYILPNTLVHGKRYILTANVKALEYSSGYTPGQNFGYGYYNGGSADYYGSFDASSNTAKLEFVYNEQGENVIGFHNEVKEGLTKLQWSNIQIEEGTVATQYEPYQEDKLTILSPVQIEKVGDIEDRIIEKDGVLGVEKNIVTYYPSLNKIYNYHSMENSFRVSSNSADAIVTPKTSRSICNLLIEGTGSDWTSDKQCCYVLTNNTLVIKGDIRNASNLEEAREWIKSSGLYIKYPTTQPQFIHLPHDQQIKLRTFANKTNISFGCEIEGTIKAQVPKSLGATVNTHTEQINNLNNELNRVKKLEESTVSTVTTESDFTTVEATSNGYFEDVKLEGKTLVNYISNFNNWSNMGSTTVSEDGASMTINATSWNKGRQISKSLPSGEYIFSINNPNNATIIVQNKTNAKTLLMGNNIDMNIKFSLLEVSEILITCKNTSETGTYVVNNPILTTDKNVNGYFEGLKSVGQSTSEDGADEIVVSSVNENLFDGELELGTISSSTGQVTPNTKRCHTPNLLIKGSTYLTFTLCGYKHVNTHFYDSLWNRISFTDQRDTESFTVNVPPNSAYVKVIYKRIDEGDITQKDLQTISKNLCVTKNGNTSSQHQSDKKRLLYYNTETQMWEKPILREWDSIEKHTDGKYYYHVRSIEEDYVEGDEIVTDYITDMTTTVKPLSQEKIYECTNMDLITYNGETNYIVESGAIVPKTTLKVHNNISNVVSLLQKKVSLLESNVTSYMITQNRLMLASRYNADTVSFKVDVASFSDTFEYDNDLYELILNNILVGKDNYNREYIENLTRFYWMDFVISDEMYSTLFEIIEEQHNPKIEEETPLI